ncbi:MAG: sulfotransferase [Rhodospirillales bacterium]|nr:MAG: sulfotransferase [Rhodospirillales bacterium]
MQERDASMSTGIAPVFMFGFERSGTTLLTMMVGAHPEIAVPFSVTGLWYRYARQVESGQPALVNGGIEALIDRIVAEERIQLWDTRLSRDDVLAVLAGTTFADVVRAFHLAYAAKCGKPYWANMDIGTLDHMDVPNRWFPDAKFIHIVRDGRDVALSNQTMPYGPGNLSEVAVAWERRLFLNLNMAAMIDPARYLVIRYEDLILRAEATLQQLCAFIGVAYAPAMLTYPDQVDGRVPSEKRWLWPALASAPDASKVGQWKAQMSRTERDLFENLAGTMLERLGYETLGIRRGGLSVHALELCHFLDRGHRLKRFGAKLGIRRLTKLERAARHGG